MPSKTDVLRVKLVTDGAGKVRAEMLGVEDSFKRVDSSGSKLAAGIRNLSGLFAVLSGAAMAGAVRGALAFGDAIDKAAERTGLGTKALQELRFAADQVGVSSRVLEDGFTRLTRRIGLFANNAEGPAAKAINQLGLSVRNTNGEIRETEDIFNDAVRELAKYESAAERSALVSQLFGEDAGPRLRLLLDQGAEGIRSLRQEAQDIGAVMSDELIDKAVDAQDSLAKLGSVLKVQVSSALVDLAPLITKVAHEFGVLAKSVRLFFGINLSALEAYTKELDNLLEKQTRLRALLQNPLSRAFGRGDKLKKELKDTENAIIAIQQAIFSLGLLVEDEPLSGLIPPGEIDKADKLAAELQKIRDRLNPLPALANAYAKELKVITDSNLGIDEQKELIRKLREEYTGLIEDITGVNKRIKETKKEVEKTADATASAFQKPFDRAAENIQRSFGDTFTDIYRNGITRFEDLTDALRDIFARLAGEITALLVFRPTILGGGLGGLGLFGSTTAGAGGAGGSIGAGGVGALLAGGNSLGLASILGLTGAGVLGGTYLSGGFGSTAGRVGGLAGGGLGAYGGLLLGSSTALGPLGIPIGALLGSLLGGGIGGLFGGNDKQKFGFTTGAGGLQTPFGGLSVTDSKNIDGAAIVRSLAGIDESIARLLSPSQIERVRGGLAGTGQFYSAHSFDNESFDVVKTRLVRIIDAVAENTVASGLLDSIGRSPENIDDLVQAAGGIIEMINLFGDAAELNQAEQALAALNQQFDDLATAAEKLGFDVGIAEAKRQQAIADLTTDFDTSIRDQILAIENPLLLALETVERAAQERLDNARTLGADLVEVERINALERERVLDQVFGGSNSSITRFLNSLKITGAGGLPIGAQVNNAESLFGTLLASARTDPAARSDLAAFLPGFVGLKREQLGSSAAFFEFTGFLDSTLRNLVDATDTVSTLEDIGSAITDGDNAIVSTLREENELLRDQLAELSADIRLLVNAPSYPRPPVAA